MVTERRFGALKSEWLRLQGCETPRGLRDAVEARGTSVACLPPCSPDLSPVEKMRSKAKALPRGLRARDPGALPGAVAWALSKAIPSGCEGVV